VTGWQSPTPGEHRWPMSIVVLAALALQVTLPAQVEARPHWLLPALATLLLIGLVASNPRRIDRESQVLRAASIVLIAILSSANAWSAIRLVRDLVDPHLTMRATLVLRAGGAIWLTNVLVFALWYWELDRGGPVARALATHDRPDFVFPQMSSPDLAPPDWEAGIVDYIFLSFTNGTAFSPTDVLPLSPWAKLAMMLQATISVSTVALVIGRAVNIFGGGG